MAPPPPCLASPVCEKTPTWVGQDLGKTALWGQSEPYSPPPISKEFSVCLLPPTLVSPGSLAIPFLPDFQNWKRPPVTSRPGPPVTSAAWSSEARPSHLSVFGFIQRTNARLKPNPMWRQFRKTTGAGIRISVSSAWLLAKDRGGGVSSAIKSKMLKEYHPSDSLYLMKTWIQWQDSST